MLNQPHFYHKTIRRCVVSFGNIFKDIMLVRYEKDTDNEIERFVVPLSYAGKENYITRLMGNPNLTDPTQIVLPKMSFEMVGLAYDPSRKISSFKNSFNKIPGDNTSVSTQRIGVPYDIDFEVNLYVRSVEDGTQIIEQILPFFTPDYTLSMNYIDSMDIARDIPIILKNIVYDQNWQGAADTTTRILTWTLQFKMKAQFFGPVNTGKIIRTSTANTFIYNDSPADHLSLSLAAGFEDYKLGEPVYQNGTSVVDAKATADVVAWDTVGRILTISNLKGHFVSNANVHGSVTNADHNVLGIVPQNGLVDTIVITPNPLTANLGDDFGFTETNTEFG